MSYVPSGGWIQECWAQLTPELLRDLRRFTAQRMAVYGLGGDPCDLVDKAVSDTSDGVLPWDPGAKSLRQHCRDALRRRIHAAFERAQRLPHHSLDDCDDAGESAVLEEAEIALWERQPHEDLAEQTSTNEYAGYAIRAFRDRAAGDPDLLLLLGALEKRVTDKTEILRMTGLSPVAYHNAYRRLVRLVKRWTADISRDKG